MTRTARMLGYNRATTPDTNNNVGDSKMAENDALPTRKASLSVKKGSTRGKNPRPIEYNAFDTEKPETLPLTQAEFMEVTGVKDQAEIVALLIDGFNAAAYSAASDEIGEFVNDAWPKDTQTQFRAAVRNMSKLTGQSIEDVATMLIPGVEKGLAAKKAAEAESAKEVVPA